MTVLLMPNSRPELSTSPVAPVTLASKCTRCWRTGIIPLGMARYTISPIHSLSFSCFFTPHFRPLSTILYQWEPNGVAEENAQFHIFSYLSSCWVPQESGAIRRPACYPGKHFDNIGWYLSTVLNRQYESLVASAHFVIMKRPLPICPVR